MSEKILESIDKRLAVITNLIARDVIKDKSLNEQIDILASVNLSVNEIAEILGKSPNNISVRLHMKKKSKKKELKKDEWKFWRRYN